MTIHLNVFVLFVVSIYVSNFLIVLLLLLIDRLMGYFIDPLFSRIFSWRKKVEYIPLDLRHEIVSSFTFTTCFMIMMFLLYWYVRIYGVGS